MGQRPRCSVKIRLGVEGGRRPILAMCRRLQAPILVSANSLWDQRRQRFGGYGCYREFDTALDSGGFVAMKRYGGYRWSVAQYVQLAGDLRPSWWAQMDFCCEPEIAAHATAVRQRIQLTARHLHECLNVARNEGVAPAMPVLQGWKPEDYTRGPIYDEPFRWPDLVGVGSVCRRHVHGPDGVLAVVDALDRVVPRRTKLHLFGVKSTALAELLKHFPHRIGSMDSMAWNYHARRLTHRARMRRDGHTDAQVMAAWYHKQQRNLTRNTVRI